MSGELADSMRKVLILGESQGWTQQKYKNELENILKEERTNLKYGNRALNKNMREWSDDKGRK